jgi:hypothetical protein
MSQAPSSPGGPERRKAPRLPVGRHVTAELESSAQPVTVRDISLGGFLLESNEPFEVQALHQFRIATSDGWKTLITARSVHSRRSTTETGTYYTGFAFVDPVGTEAERRIHQLIDKVTSVVTY